MRRGGTMIPFVGMVGVTSSPLSWRFGVTWSPSSWSHHLDQTTASRPFIISARRRIFGRATPVIAARAFVWVTFCGKVGGAGNALFWGRFSCWAKRTQETLVFGPPGSSRMCSTSSRISQFPDNAATSPEAHGATVLIGRGGRRCGTLPLGLAAAPVWVIACVAVYAGLPCGAQPRGAHTGATSSAIRKTSSARLATWRTTKRLTRSSRTSRSTICGTI
mmetsp:Transcript_20710/g.50662  ORF Transcript_20710/g.50662 Transcript_20710/m.50662 type:complete len:219 (+) Transcript_20710:1887-2543(+)